MTFQSAGSALSVPVNSSPDIRNDDSTDTAQGSGARHPSIVMIVANFAPESNAGAKRITPLAEQFAARGWRVTVITPSPHHPQNEIYEGYKGRHKRVERLSNGITIYRVRPWIVDKSKLALRVLSEAYFCVKAFPLAIRIPSDIVFTSTPYMFLAPLGLMLAKLKRARFAFDVRDLTWQYPAAAGRRTFGIDKLLGQMVKTSVRYSDILSATTRAQLDYFRNRPAVSLEVPNGVSDEVLKRLTAIHYTGDINATPNIVYAGVIGYNQNLTILLETAALLPHMSFTIIGDGPEKHNIAEHIKLENLQNVVLKPYMAFDELCKEYERADILVSHVRNNPIFRNMQSAKVWEYMSTGRPVIHGGVGTSVEYLNRHRLGLGIKPDDPVELATAIQELVNDRTARLEISHNAREHVSEHYRRSSIFATYIDTLQKLIAQSCSG